MCLPGRLMAEKAHIKNKRNVARQAPAKDHLRLCLVCRTYRRQGELLRVTFDRTRQLTTVNMNRPGGQLSHGRSAYVCPSLTCLEPAIKTDRLRRALSGRTGSKGKAQKNKPGSTFSMPLESQLIHTLTSICTDIHESCQNNQMREGLK